ncbi:hypothetical protein NOR53_2828 [gamma proteobacterium NOR5-3]|nr:hypothetical protein NOR53_2828 [gamma proteobacterium NOR5-3]
MRQLDVARRNIEIASEKIRSDEFREAKKALERLGPQILDAEAVQELFNRHFKTELDQIYATKKEIYEQLDDAYGELAAIKIVIDSQYRRKDAAFSDLNIAKNEVDRWYRRSNSHMPFYGSAGRKINRNSWFSQDFNDLDRAKSERDDAYSRVVKAKDAIGRTKRSRDVIYSNVEGLKNQVGALRERTRAVKAARRRYYELKKEGVDRRTAKVALDRLLARRTEINASIVRIKEERELYVRSEMLDQDISSKTLAVQKMEEQHKRFVDSFDSSAEAEKRRNAHRKQWLSERGIVT